MTFHAANPAGSSHLFPCLVEQANNSLQTCNGGGGLHPSLDGNAGPIRGAIARNFRSQCADEDSALEPVCRCVFRLCSGTASGLVMRPAATRSSASAAPPFGLRFPSKSCSESTPKRFLRTLRKSRPSALGSMAHSPGSAQCDPSRIGKFNETETTSCTRTK